MAFDKIIIQEAHRAIAHEFRPDDIEDLCQEARVKVLLENKQIARARNPLACCRSIARNEMIDWIRREVRHEHEPLSAEI